MNYQEIIETAHNMTQNPQILAALEDGALLAEKESEWSQMEPDEIIADIESDIICHCCGEHEILDDTDLAAEMLCDRCNREINEDAEIIGWRKGE